MRAAVLMPVVVLAVSAGHAEMGFAQGLPGQQNSPMLGVSAPASNFTAKRILVAYGAAYGAPGNQPNYTPNGGRPNVSLPGIGVDDTSSLTPAQRAAAALATIKIPGVTSTGGAPAYQPAMPTISSVSPTYGAPAYGAPSYAAPAAIAPAPAPTAVPMPVAVGVGRPTQAQVVIREPRPGQITGLPLGMSNNMGGAASAPLVNEINSAPSQQPHSDNVGAMVPQAPVAAAEPVYRSVAPAAPPAYGAPTAQTVTYRAAPYVPPAAYRAPAAAAPAPMSYAAPAARTVAVDPASCVPAASNAGPATTVAYQPAAPVVLPRPAEPERLPVVAGGPGFMLVAPPPGAPYPSAGYVEPGNIVGQTVAAAAPATSFLPTTQAHVVGKPRVRAVSTHHRVGHTNSDPWANPQ